MGTDQTLMRTRLLTAIAAIGALMVGGLAAVPAAADPTATATIWVAPVVKESGGYLQIDPPNIQVSATNIDTGQTFTGFTDDSYGNWIGGVPTGRYRISVKQVVGMHTYVESATSWWPGVFSQAASSPVTLNGNIQDCDANAPPSTGCWGVRWEVELQQNRSLTGAVRARSGQGMAARTVAAKKVGEEPTRFTSITDASGRFSMAVPPGKYELSSPNGDTTATTSVVVDRPAQSADVVLKDPPAPPRDVVAVAGSKSISVIWTPSSDNGELASDGYDVKAAQGGQSCTVGASQAGCTITNLANNKSYTVSVTSRNAVGSSSAATSNLVTPLDPAPDAPVGVQAIARDKAATVSWSPPRIGGDTVLGYRVTAVPGGFTCTTTDLTCEVQGLTNGVGYVFQVVATSTGGDSALSAPSSPTTPAGVSTPPRSVSADPGDRSVMVSWNTPLDDGGAPILGYTATAWPAGRTCTTADVFRQCVIAGLVNGQEYTVTVTATNRVGTSERSPGSVQVTPKSSLPSQREVSSAKVRLSKGRVSKGRTVVKWSTTGARQVKVSWQRLPGGQKKQQVTAARGSMVLKGQSGTRFRVAVAGTNAAGETSRTWKVVRLR